MFDDKDGGLGAVGAIIALVVVVAILWFLAREGRNNDGCYNNGGGYPVYPPYAPYAPYGGGGNCCSPLDCKIPMAPDMSNCEVDKDLWKVDADIWKSACDVKETVKDGDQKILNKICDQELKAVERALATALADKTAIESKFYTEKKFDELAAMLCKYDNGNDKQYYNLSAQIAALKSDFDCNVPKRAPIYACGTTPDVHNIDCHDFPRRSKGCCDNDCGYGYSA